MDARVRVYLVLTTFNSLVDLVFQDEFAELLMYFVLRLAAFWILLGTSKKKISVSATAARYTIAVFLLMSVAYWIHRSPAIWDSNQWAMQADLVVGLWFLFYSSETVDQTNDSSFWLCATVSQMYCQYYLAAGFFKINSHFLDPNASCATMFAVQHISYYVGPFLSTSTLVDICSWVKPVAPALTLFVELSMAGSFTFGQLFQSRKWINIGLMYILYFHLAVCLTPEPVDISMFALQCGCRLVMALEPTSLDRALQKIRPYTLPLTTIAILWVSYGMQSNFTPLNWSFAGYVPVLALHTLTVRLQTSPAVTQQPTTARPAWSYMAIGVAFFYAFGSIILGLQEEATCNMFANLKIHGGSNHLLVPTGLLLEGPEIRVQATDSPWFTTTYPADFSAIVEPAVVADVMSAIGTPTPFYFNGGANRVLGIFEKGWVPHNGVFIPYTVPALEFRRLFAEALERDETFTLEYVELPGRGGDEVWRATAAERTVQVTVQAGSVTRCKANGKPCSLESELVYQPFADVSWLRRTFSMYHGYPILFQPDGNVRPSIACFGP